VSRVLATYALRHPIVRETRDAEGNEHEEELRPAGFIVVIKRPRAKDMRALDKFGDGVGGSIAIIARLTNLSDEEADLLDAEDFGELGNVLDEHAPNGPTTGETP
jgi:hypothetical protein